MYALIVPKVSQTSQAKGIAFTFDTSFKFRDSIATLTRDLMASYKFELFLCELQVP